MVSDEPFGGLAVLAVGDLLKLPPVCERAVYKIPTDNMAAIYGSLWLQNFHIYELEEIMRQKNDQWFAFLLNCIRLGNVTDEDIDFLKKRQCAETPEALNSVTHIFATNAAVNNHNQKMLNMIVKTILTKEATDSKNDTRTNRLSTANFTANSGGLPKQLKIGIGARVMLLKNLNVDDGLVNSALGTVTGFLPTMPTPLPPDYLPKYILVHFDDTNVGLKTRHQMKRLLTNDHSTPIVMSEEAIRLGRSAKVSGKRLQFPLTLAWALTIHKEQGRTEDKLVISCQGRFHAGQLYTALSRTKTIKGMTLIGDFTKNKIKPNMGSLKEIHRMKKHMPLVLPIPYTINQDSDLYFKLSFLNINSLSPHFLSLKRDQWIMDSDIIALAETWPSSQHTFNQFDIIPYVPFRKDRYNSSSAHNHGGGVFLYCHEKFHILKQIILDVPLEYLSIVISPRFDSSIRICINVIYTAVAPTEVFLTALDTLLHALPHHAMPTIICGDFNISVHATNKPATQLSNLMKHHGFIQLCTQPTHNRGGTLDHIYINCLPHVTLSNMHVYYTDHHHLKFSVPYPCLHA